MKLIAINILIMVSAFAVFGQLEVDPSFVDQGTFDPNLQEISLDKFEDPGFWKVEIPIDDGIIQHRALRGAPDAKDPLIIETALAPQSAEDDFVLGVRTDFFRRTHSTLSILPSRPIPIPGIAHTFSIWVAGRNTPHELRLFLRDAFGEISILSFGKLRFLGWKKLSVAVPPRIQEARYVRAGSDINTGLEVIGFQVASSLLETYGRYYIYFDDLRVVTDVSALERDPDDMVDNW